MFVFLFKSTAIVTPKFYVKPSDFTQLHGEIEVKIKSLLTTTPQEKYKYPMTENQMCNTTQ